MVAIVVDCGTKPTWAESESVPVFTDHRSIPQFGVGEGVGVGLGEGLTPHEVDAERLFRGLGAPVAKSELLLFVSVQPLLIRTTAVVLLGADVAAVPSKQLAVLP